MKLSDIKAKSKEELVKIVDTFYSSPYINIYLSTKAQLDKLSTQIENASIDFEEGEKVFDQFLKWGEKSLIISDNLQSILEKIDKDILLEEQKKRLSAKKGSVEQRRRNA